MNCYLHAGIASTATCVACAQPICAECCEEVAGHAMCRPCVAAAQARLAAEPDMAVPAPSGGAIDRAGEVVTSAPLFDMGAGPELAAAARPVLAPPAVAPKEFVRPGIARRLARGLLWGVVYGQWWTLWTIFSLFIWGQGSLNANLVWFAVDRGIFYGFFGSVAGLVIAAVNAPVARGVVIGVGMGVLLCLLQMALDHSALEIVNLLFFFFTGRYVGAGIAWRVQQPVRRKMVLGGG